MARQPEPPNYDEDKIPPYVLPDPLRFLNGARVTHSADWPERRAEILRLFSEQMYGKAPAKPPAQRFEVIAEDRSALGGLATRKQVRLLCEWYLRVRKSS